MKETTTIHKDILIVGSGIAGLSCALYLSKALPKCSILILTKTKKDETNTKYAQGGIAAVSDFLEDSFDKHINDTIEAGAGLCNKACVDMVVKEAPSCIQDILDVGVNFDKNEKGDFDLGKEGGHSENRILHHKDITGYEIEKNLLQEINKSNNISINQNFFAIDLITEHHLGYLITKSTPNITCYGIYALDYKTKQIIKILSSTTILASGGGGQIYKTTTNPSIASGDGVAMFYRAKGRVENMEFIQFHPTALYEENTSTSFLISEALRGKGAILKNSNNEAFMSKYHKKLELAPRDIVAKAIDHEMKKTGSDFVYLDCSSINTKQWESHFPNIYKKSLSIGINPKTDYLPVAPASHYVCGGIKTNLKGETSIKNIYACGECASTGLHGANRLASNSLLEAIVFSKLIAQHLKNSFSKKPIEDNFPEWRSEGTTSPKEMILITQSKKELKSIMSDYVGIVRSDIRLQRANKRIDLLYEENEKLYETTKISPQICELRNMITLAYLVIKSAKFRKESRGLHYNIDYPSVNSSIQNIIL